MRSAICWPSWSTWPLEKAAKRQAWTAEQLQAIIKEWHSYLTLGPEAGRQALRLLLDGPITVTRQADGGWRYQGQAC